jgi:bifunctional oligoribonuclease and PAP phosphatase NrnA
MTPLHFTPLNVVPAFDSSLLKVAALIRTNSTFCIITHVNSDGDSLGSQLGLYHLLLQLGKTVSLINPSRVPENFRFLPGSEHIRVFDEQRDSALLSGVDVLFVLDGNSPARMRGMETAIVNSSATKAVIDHHQEPAAFASLYAIDTEACSTAELVYRLLAHFPDVPLTREIAEALYTGIMTDTGNFRFPRTTPEVHRIVAHLMEAGVEPYTIFDNVFNQNLVNRARLLGATLSTMELHEGGKLCMMLVTEEMMRQTGTNLDHIEGFVEQTLGIQGVRIGALVVELEKSVKMSFRSKGTIPVNKIANFFGGGGHINAAGSRTETMRMGEAKQKIIDLAATLLSVENYPRISTNLHE